MCHTVFIGFAHIYAWNTEMYLKSREYQILSMEMVVSDLAVLLLNKNHGIE